MNTFTCKGFETLSTEQQQAIVRMVELACDHFGSTPTAVSSKDLLASVAERESLERGGQVAVSEACTHDWYQGAYVRSCINCGAIEHKPRLANDDLSGS